MKDYIGYYVKEFESGSRGSNCLVQCGNDWGLSCGTYQLTLRWGNCINFLKKYFPELAMDLYFNKNMGDFASEKFPGYKYCSTPEQVKKVWNLCIDTVGVDEFFLCEHEYIQNNFYEPLMKSLNGLFNPNDHSRALQESLWSWSVHKGSSGAYKGFKELGINQNTSVEEALKKIYDYRYSVNKFDRYSTLKTSERAKLLGIKDLKPLSYNGTNPSSNQTPIGNVVNPKPDTSGEIKGTKCDKAYKIICKELNVRKGNGTSYDILRVLKFGSFVNVIETKNGWGKLKSGGWINISTKYCANVKVPFTFIVDKEKCTSLNIRKSANSNSGKCGSIEAGNTIYTIVEVKGNWGKLKSGAGWICLDYITIK